MAFVASRLAWGVSSIPHGIGTCTVLITFGVDQYSHHEISTKKTCSVHKSRIGGTYTSSPRKMNLAVEDNLLSQRNMRKSIFRVHIDAFLHIWIIFLGFKFKMFLFGNPGSIFKNIIVFIFMTC